MDDTVFDELTRRHYRELHVHCYRMLGSFDAAEDHVQEVFLKAWRSREGFDGRSSVRTWLYRIATNACLDTLRRGTPRLQPYPDHLLDDRPGPEAAAVARETVSLAFLAAIQLLPPRQRAVLLLRDVLSWSAGEAADLLGTTVRAANSALHRARTTMRERWPDGRLTLTAPAGEPDAAQRNLLARYITAHEQADPQARGRRLPARGRRHRVPSVRADRAEHGSRAAHRDRHLRGPRTVPRVRPAGGPGPVAH